MRKTIILLVIAILLISAFPTIVFAASPGSPTPASSLSSAQILVRFKPEVTLSEAAQIHRQLGGQVKETIPGIGVQVVTVPKRQNVANANTCASKPKGQNVASANAAYASNPRVAYVEPDFVVQAVGDPDDPYFGRQWGLTKIGAPQAWDVTSGSPSINIAILDTGVDLDHPDLADKVVSNINFTTSPTVDDVCGHGTHVAGIAAAVTNNGIGVAGLGNRASIMNVKVLNDNGCGTYSGMISGIIWAVDNGAEVINLSLGGSGYSSALEDAVNYAWSKGVVVVAAAGNSGSTTPFYPAVLPNCIAVAATDGWDDLASFSNYGSWVDVAAPGVAIYATLKDSGYGYKGGTSMASPHVAGLAALVFTTVSDTNGDGHLNDEVRSRIEATCDDIGVTGIGHGRINAAQAVGDGAPVLPGSISGQVTDAEDGSPIAGAAVTDGARTTTTDATGQYTIADVPAGSHEVTASKEGYEAASLTVNVLSGDTAIANLSLNEIILPGSVTGSVTDAADGSPIAGATVSDGTRTTTTDVAGEYTIGDVPPGTCQVTASKSGYESASAVATVVSGGNALVDFSLTEVILPDSITGSVTDAENGSAIAGATVTDGTRTTTTNALGKYTIANVPSMHVYQVTASKQGYESSSLWVIVLPGRTTLANLSLTEITLPGSITGSVTDAEDGSPITGATVTDGTRTTTTDALGEYAIADVPAGSHEVTASKEGYQSSSMTVNVLSGSSAVANLSLTEVVLPGSVTGSVTDAGGGSPIAGATVTDGMRMTTTDATGKYTIADVPPGTYQVTASKSGYESSMSTVTVISGGAAVMNFSLNPEPVPVNTMWVNRVRFSRFGNSLFVEVSVVTASGIVVGADVDLALVCSTGELWNFSGTTNTAGFVKFHLGKAPVGSYVATVTGLTYSGFTWDTSKGITAVSYALSG